MIRNNLVHIEKFGGDCIVVLSDFTEGPDACHIFKKQKSGININYSSYYFKKNNIKKYNSGKMTLKEMKKWLKFIRETTYIA